MVIILSIRGLRRQRQQGEGSSGKSSDQRRLQLDKNENRIKNKKALK